VDGRNGTFKDRTSSLGPDAGAHRPSRSCTPRTAPARRRRSLGSGAGPGSTRGSHVLPFHPSRDLARGIAAEGGLDVVAQERLFRAGLLHDNGKLGVSSRILDKPGALEALTANGPYRTGMPRRAALVIIGRDRGSRLCSAAIDALEAHTLTLDDVSTEL
jgi:hypothetical protein